MVGASEVRRNSHKGKAEDEDVKKFIVGNDKAGWRESG